MTATSVRGLLFDPRRDRRRYNSRKALLNMLNRPTTAAHGLPGQPPLPLSYPAELYANHAPYQAHISPLGPNPSSLHPPGGMQGGIPTQLTGGGMSSQLTANSMHGAPPPGTGVPMGPMYLPVATPGGSGVGRGIAPGPSSGPPGMARAVLPNGQSRFAPGGAVRMGMPPHGTNGPQSAMTLPTTMGGLGGSVGMGVGRGGPQPGPGGNILSGGLNPAAKPLQRVSSTPNLHSPMHGMSAGPGYSPGPHFPPSMSPSSRLSGKMLTSFYSSSTTLNNAFSTSTIRSTLSTRAAKTRAAYATWWIWIILFWYPRDDIPATTRRDSYARGSRACVDAATTCSCPYGAAISVYASNVAADTEPSFRHRDAYGVKSVTNGRRRYGSPNCWIYRE